MGWALRSPGIPWLCGSSCSLSLLSRASTGLPFQQKGAAHLSFDLQSRLWCEEGFPYGLLKGWGGFGVHLIWPEVQGMDQPPGPKESRGEAGGSTILKDLA